jgi:putative DNA primase/helicase
MPTEQNDLSLAVIHGLEGNERSGECRCPCHKDEHPSLSVKAGHTGKVIVKCWAGCSQDRVLTELRRRGFRLSPKERDYENRKATRERQQAERQREAEFEQKRLRAMGILRRATADLDLVRRYLNGRRITSIPPCARALDAKQCRELFDRPYPAMVVPIIKPKVGVIGAQVTFLSRDGSTKLNIKKPRLIYGNLKGGYVVVGWLDESKPLLAGEGVESVASACQITGLPGIAALSNTNLPAIIPPPAPELITVGDNDKAGREGAEQAAEVWTQSGRVVRMAMPGDPEEEADWNDVLVEDHDNPDALAWWRNAIVQAPAEEPPEHVEALGMERFMQLQFPPRKFLLQPWLTTTALTMIDAPAGHGKTWLALSIGYAVGSGKGMLDWAVQDKVPVLYVDGELPGALLQERLRQLGTPLPAREFRVLSRAQFELFGQQMLDLGTEEGRDFLDDYIERYHIGLIIIDSVSTLVRTGVDNDVESWRAIQDWSLKHRAKGRAVIYLHHHGRSGNPRGTSSREIVLDSRIKLTWKPDAGNEERRESAFQLEFPKAREFFGADAAPKMLYLSTPSGVVKWRWEPLQASNRERVKALMATMSPSEIAKELKLTKGRVSQLISEIRGSAVRRVEREEGDVAAEAEYEVVGSVH